MTEGRATGEAPVSPDRSARLAEQARRRWIVLMTNLALPATIAFERGLGWLLSSDDLDAIGVMLAPTTTLVAWGLCGLTAGASAAALVAGHWLASRGKLGVGAFLLAASLAQLPAMLTALMPLVGAAYGPVWLAAAMATATIVLLAIRTTHGR